jgi:parallel beta-helix repeat protein
MKHSTALVAFLLIQVPVSLSAQTPDTLELRAGMEISRSAVIRPGRYSLAGDSTGVIRIHGRGIDIDFSGAELIGSVSGDRPDEFAGVGIRITGGEEITIRNLTVRGYKVGLIAEDVDELQIENSDFSYNYRQHLKSTLENEHLDDWMSYHQNEKDEWLRYGAGIYLSRVRSPVIHDVTITGGQNGIMLTCVEDGSIYNNSITFNSGIGIGLYRSSRNRIQNNALDFNVRGYSHGVYNRGQDSAAILVYEQSNGNVFAYNSATHSGDGFFLWAGQSTMDTGEGGSNDNWIYGNDFSYAPTNGIEVTFSRNRIERNRIAGCWHGIWGGYSFDTRIAGNDFIDNEEHIAIEHGQQIEITENLFMGGKKGVRAWERERQSEDWGYSQNRDVRSRDYRIEKNRFVNVATPLDITKTLGVQKVGNTVESRDAEIESRWSGKDARRQSDGPPRRRDGPPRRSDGPPRRSDGPPRIISARRVLASPEARLDRSYILVDDRGPYDFRSPLIWPRSPRQAREQRFEILGPEGIWTLDDSFGVDSVSARRGRTGDFITVWVSMKNVIDLTLNLTYIGAETTDRFGRVTPAGESVPFSYHYFFVPIQWEVGWFAYDDANDPRTHPAEFDRLLDGAPAASETTQDLAYQFYRSPAEGLPPDRFATRAVGSLVVPEGDYILQITSDDGVRVFLDGVKIYEDWTWHPPRQAEIPLYLSGEHRIRIDHFEIDGYAALIARLLPADAR